MYPEPIFDIALSYSNHSTRVSFMPDNVDTANVTDALKIKIFE
jgi:hypothetical protein